MKNKNILIIGAGVQATKKIKLLCNYKCKITIISEEFDKEIIESERKYNLKLIKKKIEEITFLNAFDNLFIIFITTNDKSLNDKITQWATNAKILTYSASDPKKSDLAFLPIINVEKIIQIGISTFGKSPLMTKIIKDKVEKNIKNIIGKNDIDNIKIQEFARRYAKRYIERSTERKDFLYDILNNSEIQELISKNNIDKVKERIINTLEKLEDNKGR